MVAKVISEFMMILQSLNLWELAPGVLCIILKRKKNRMTLNIWMPTDLLTCTVVHSVVHSRLYLVRFL